MQTYNITKQINAIHTAIKLCLDIENLIADNDVSTINTAKVDYYVQTLISKLYTIDAIHTAYNNIYFSHSSAYQRYLELIHSLLDKYETILTLLKNKKENIGAKLYWQDLFIRTIFKDPKIPTNASQHIEYEVMH